MPNWCSNHVEVSHTDPSKIIEFEKACKTGSLFNHFVNRPLEEEDNWYQWNIDNWGTKWDVDADDIDFERVDGQVHASFDTAWGPPLAFYRSLEEDHGYKVIGYYIESGQDFCGIYEDGDYEHYDIDENVPDRLDEVFNIKDMLADREDEGF